MGQGHQQWISRWPRPRTAHRSFCLSSSTSRFQHEFSSKYGAQGQEYENGIIGFEKVEQVLRFGVKKIMRLNINTLNVVVEGETDLCSVKYWTAKACCRLACHIRENGSNLAK